jgi:hypothetical protein
MSIVHKIAPNRVLRAFVVVGVAAGVTMVAPAPAFASVSNICGTMVTGAVDELSHGRVRQTSGGHLHDIAWHFFTTPSCTGFFPDGGSLRVRVQFLQRNSSGGCTTNVLSSGVLRIFTGPQRQTLATDVLSGTCYRLVWRPTNSVTANRSLPGTIVLLDT